MSDPKVTVRATVTLTLRVDAEGVWGGDCPIDQVNKQARASAVGIVRRLVDGKANGRVSVVGAPQVVAVILEERL